MIRHIGLGTKLRRLTASLDDGVQAIYDANGLGFRPRYFPIVTRLQDGSATVGELAVAIGVSQPAVTQTLHEMIGEGLVEIAIGEDRRSRIVSLSDHGQRIASQLDPIWQATAAAAEALDALLPMPLAAVIDAAQAKLDVTSFDRMIAAELENSPCA